MDIIYHILYKLYDTTLIKFVTTNSIQMMPMQLAGHSDILVDPSKLKFSLIGQKMKFHFLWMTWRVNLQVQIFLSVSKTQPRTVVTPKMFCLDADQVSNVIDKTIRYSLYQKDIESVYNVRTSRHTSFDDFFIEFLKLVRFYPSKATSPIVFLLRHLPKAKILDYVKLMNRPIR